MDGEKFIILEKRQKKVIKNSVSEFSSDDSAVSVPSVAV